MSGPPTIDFSGLVRLMQGRTQVFDVLPAAEYEHGHIPASLSLPLNELTADTAAEMVDATLAVVVYCADAL